MRSDATAETTAPRDLAALILAAVCWGLGTVVSKAALAEIPPVSLLTIQLASSLLVLVVLMRANGIPLRGNAHSLLGRLGLLNPGAAYALSLVGLLTITASVSVLLWAFEPLMILFLAAIVLRERITRELVVLSLIALAGLVLVVYEPTAIDGRLVGIALTLVGIGCCAAYTVITRRFIPDAQETSQVVLAQQAYGFVLAVVLAFAVAVGGGALLPTSLTPIGLSSAVLSGALYYAGAYWLYLGALRRVQASVAAASFYLIPIVGVTGGAFLLGERLGASQYVGGAIALGAVIGIFARSRSASASAAAPAVPIRPS